MRIVDRKTFLKMPSGIAYVKFPVRWAANDGIMFKADARAPDGEDFGWLYWNPAWVDAPDSVEALDRLDRMIDQGASYPMDEAIGRDGYFDQGDMFMIFEHADLVKLSEAIHGAMQIAEEVKSLCAPACQPVDSSR